MLPYSRQLITAEDIEAVKRVLESEYITQGPAVKVFEDDLSTYCNSKYSIATNSATSALHLACLALELKAGDFLWTSPITFVASANCALYCGASVDFIDINPHTLNLDCEALEEKLIDAEKKGILPKILVAVHFGGLPCDMEKISKLGKKYNFRIIEDASHALGSKDGDYLTGSCEFSDITIFSFHPVKIITSGEGGAITTNSESLYRRCILLRSHGITKDEEFFEDISDGSWCYEQQALGYNYRLTDIQAALGASQLKRLNSYIDLRNDVAKFYTGKFAKLDINMQTVTEVKRSSYHLFPIQLNNKVDRKNLFDFLRAKSIGVNVLYKPVYLQPYYRKLGFKLGYCPNAENYYERSICLPIFPAINKEECEYVVNSVFQYYGEGC
jgi:UDP-4-amino-4,6-dideoxy-N-acetyl-beta-L-altrosamine transaminase